MHIFLNICVQFNKNFIELSSRSYLSVHYNDFLVTLFLLSYSLESHQIEKSDNCHDCYNSRKINLAQIVSYV